MQTECRAEPSAFGRVEGRPVMAAFNGGALTSDAGGLLLGPADRRVNLVRRLAGCFRDARDPRFIEHGASPPSASPEASPRRRQNRGNPPLGPLETRPPSQPAQTAQSVRSSVTQTLRTSLSASQQGARGPRNAG